MEIEKKYLVKQIPEALSQYKEVTIEQGYLSVEPTIRIRRWGNEYKLTYKSRESIQSVDGTNVSQEVELPLTREAYEHLRAKVDGQMIEKTRYLIPMENELVIELDIFHGSFDGRVLAEVEFPTVEMASQFIEPDWFGENVSNQKQYTNSYMSREKLTCID